MSRARVVAYLNPTAQLGGAEQSLLDLATAVDHRRWEPRLLCVGQGPLIAEAGRRGLPARSVSAPSAFVRTSLRGARTGALGVLAASLSAAPAFLATRGEVRRAGAAIVHTNGNKAHLLSLGLWPVRSGLVWHVRDFLRDGALERILVRFANFAAKAVIANSAAVATRLADLGVRPALVHAIPNGIDLRRFTADGVAADLRREFGWPKEARLVGMVGVLARWKGQEVFLRAAAEVAARCSDVRFLVVGAEIYETAGHGEYEAVLRGLARDLGFGDRLAFCGYRADIPEVLRGLDVVVHASIEPEPFGRVIAEAMACERPIVWARGGGADEIVGDTGLRELGVPRANPSALAAAIERALAEADRVRAWAVEGRRRIQRHFDLRDHARRVQEVYELVLAGGR